MFFENQLFWKIHPSLTHFRPRTKSECSLEILKFQSIWSVWISKISFLRIWKKIRLDIYMRIWSWEWCHKMQNRKLNYIRCHQIFDSAKFLLHKVLRTYFKRYSRYICVITYLLQSGTTNYYCNIGKICKHFGVNSLPPFPPSPLRGYPSAAEQLVQILCPLSYFYASQRQNNHDF